MDLPPNSSDTNSVPATGEPLYPFVKLIEYVKKLLAEGKPDIYRHVIQEVDRHMFQEVMRHFHGNQLQAAERLGISRMTLRSKLRSLGLIQDRSHHNSNPT